MAVPGALPRGEQWKNNRKRSLYVEEGFAGFIFYRKSKSLCERKEEVPSAEEEKQPEPNPPVDEVAAESCPLSDQQLERLVEVKSFVDQLKREMQTKGLCGPDDKLEEVCTNLHEELRQEVITGSGTSSYMEFLEASGEEDRQSAHPMDAQLAESVAQLKQKINLCERETGEWEQLMESKKTEAQTITQDLESDLGVDLSQLGPEDGEKLGSHLSPEHRGWLDQATRERDDQVWERQTEEVIRSVGSRIDGELERIQTYSESVFQRCSEEAAQLEVPADLPTQTPRTLFRALKDTTTS